MTVEIKEKLSKIERQTEKSNFVYRWIKKEKNTKLMKRKKKIFLEQKIRIFSTHTNMYIHNHIKTHIL